MKIQVAQSAGFCFGVRRAIDIALQAARTEQDVYMLGEIVHNESVVDQIQRAGIRVVDRIDDIPAGVLLFRAHGSTPETYAEAEARGLKIVDATCPMVLEIHRIVRKLEEEGYEVVIIGDQNHDEVRGIAAQVSRPLVVSGPADVPGEGWRSNRLGVVVQSTQNLENVQAIISRLVPACRELRFIDTICKPTTDHQNEIRRMPLENDAVVVVGSFTSANTRRLAELSVAANPRTHHVQTASELEAAWFEGIGSVGVTAGASTPDVLIRDVLDRIRDFRPDTVVDPDERVSPEGAEAEPTATGGRP